MKTHSRFLVLPFLLLMAFYPSRKAYGLPAHDWALASTYAVKASIPLTVAALGTLERPVKDPSSLISPGLIVLSLPDLLVVGNLLLGSTGNVRI